MLNVLDLIGSGRFWPEPIQNRTKKWPFLAKSEKSQFDFFRGGKCIHWGVAFFWGHILDPFLDRSWPGPGKPVILVIFDQNRPILTSRYWVFPKWSISGKTVKKGSKKGSKNRTPKKVGKNGLANWSGQIQGVDPSGSSREPLLNSFFSKYVVGHVCFFRGGQKRGPKKS